jgi:hypothetical protein
VFKKKVNSALENCIEDEYSSEADILLVNERISDKEGSSVYKQFIDFEKAELFPNDVVVEYLNEGENRVEKEYFGLPVQSFVDVKRKLLDILASELWSLLLAVSLIEGTNPILLDLAGVALGDRLRV